jgi:hypothetical protein
VIKKEILDQLQTPKNRMKIAQAIGLGEQAVYLAIKSNKPVLMNYIALRTIKEIVGAESIDDLINEFIVEYIDLRSGVVKATMANGEAITFGLDEFEEWCNNHDIPYDFSGLSFKEILQEKTQIDAKELVSDYLRNL